MHNFNVNYTIKSKMFESGTEAVECRIEKMNIKSQ